MICVFDALNESSSEGMKKKYAFKRPGASLSNDHVILQRTPLEYTAILNIQHYFSRFRIFISVSDQNFCTAAHHLFFNVMLQYCKPQIISSDRGLAFTGKIVQLITEMEGILHEFSAPYHLQSMRLVKRSNQTIQDALNKM